MAFSRLPGVTVTGLCFRNRARADNLARKLDPTGIQVYDRWEELIERGDIDALNIATGTAPPPRRASIAAALERGLHLLVEERLSFDLSETRELVQMVDRAKTVTAISVGWLYSPGSQVARRAVQAGAIGRVLGISVNRYHRFTADPAKFFRVAPSLRRTETGGGAIRLLGGGEFDRVRFLTGAEFTQVVGLRQLPPEPVPGANGEDCYLLLAELTSGCLGEFRLQFTRGQSEWRTVLFGAEGGHTA